MTTPVIDPREALWTQFLQRWPLERLAKLTLAQYNQAGADDHFCRWVEKHTESLGSIWGGSSLKFGIYSQDPGKARSPTAQKGVLEDGSHGWYARYGATAEAAFAKVRELVVQTAVAARAGRLDEVEQIDLWPIFRRKIAFLYQDRQQPCLLPIYMGPMLQQGWAGDGPAPKHPLDLYAGLMAQRAGRPLLAYYDEVLGRVHAAQAREVEAEKTALLARFAAAPALAPTLHAAGQVEAFVRLALALHGAGLDWWVTGDESIHAGRTDDPKVWQTVVALALKCSGNGVWGRLNTPGQTEESWQRLDRDQAERWADEAGADPRVPALSGRDACWPDDYDSSDTLLTIQLNEAAVRNGYIKVPKLQALFPARYFAANEGAPSDTFTLLLPGGGQVQTRLLSNRQALQARMQAVFTAQGVKAGDRITLRKEGDDLYRLSLGSAPAAGLQPPQPAARTATRTPMNPVPLNQILFGPPGTGKTYATIDHALAILDPALLAQHQGDPSPEARAALKRRFDELTLAGRIRFVTFHQSFSYEDFVEGIRAQSGPDGLVYSVEPGVFKQLCDAAAGSNSLDQVIQQFLDDAAVKPLPLTTPKGKSFTVTYQEGNATVACLPASSTTKKPLPANIESVRSILQGKRPQKIYCESYVQGIVAHLQPQLPAQATDPNLRQPHVLVIDEVNRGNVSRIFGELITLIEPSKRQGAAEALSITLPYSRESFSVPDNVYLIGTMNTADRSLAGLDVALRRRFVFKETLPQPELLDGVVVHGVDIGELLRLLNARIEALLDREHCLGHAYFMPLKGLAPAAAQAKLAEVFANQVLPLLQEYFFDDWQRIQWVLNDHRKPKQHQFVQSQALDALGLFGTEVNAAPHSHAWRVNTAAFEQAASYQGVMGVAAPTAGQDLA